MLGLLLSHGKFLFCLNIQIIYLHNCVLNIIIGYFVYVPGYSIVEMNIYKWLFIYLFVFKHQLGLPREPKYSHLKELHKAMWTRFSLCKCHIDLTSEEILLFSLLIKNNFCNKTVENFMSSISSYLATWNFPFILIFQFARLMFFIIRNMGFVLQSWKTMTKNMLWMWPSKIGNIYGLPPWSISILPDCQNESLNTARMSKSLTATIIILGKYNLC